MSALKEFKEFAIKGNVVDLAVAVIIGGAFGLIVKSFVNDIIMPPIGVLMGGVDFSDLTLVIQEAKVATTGAKAVAEVTLNYGAFLQTIINFLIVAVAIFAMVKVLNSLKKKEAEKPAEEPKTPEDIELLREIRDSLKK